MNKAKSIFTKILLTSMIMAIFFSSSLTATASAAVNSDLISQPVQPVKDEVLTDRAEHKIQAPAQMQVQSSSLPPRQSPKDPFWKWFTAIFAGFVGLQLAQTITQNAINNGIDAACKKWKNTSDQQNIVV